METEESNTFDKPYNVLVSQVQETLNKPLPPHWSTSMQAFHDSGSAPTPILNPYPAASYFYPTLWANQACSMPLQYDSLHDPTRLSNYSTVAGDFPPAENQQCNTMLGNGEDAQKVTSIENCDAVHVNTTFATHNFAANATELYQNLGTGLNASLSSIQLANLHDDEIRKERKRQSNRESAKRSRIRKQQECEELRKHVDTLRFKNSSLKNRLVRLSEICGELMDENKSIQEELVEIYGPESIADLMHMKPA